MATPRKKTPAKKTAAKKAPAKKAAAKKKSGNPANQPPRRVRRAAEQAAPAGPTSAKAWKGKKSKKPHELALPSGNVCLVRRVGMESFIRGGMIPNSLLGIVEGALNQAKAGQEMTKDDEERFLREIMDDPTKADDMFNLVDAVTVAVVVEPEVLAVPMTTKMIGGVATQVQDDDAMDDDLLYVIDVDMEDKMEIFNFVVGGTDDYESFRGEAAERLASLDDGQGDPSAAE